MTRAIVALLERKKLTETVHRPSDTFPKQEMSSFHDKIEIYSRLLLSKLRIFNLK